MRFPLMKILGGIHRCIKKFVPFCSLGLFQSVVLQIPSSPHQLYWLRELCWSNWIMFFDLVAYSNIVSTPLRGSSKLYMTEFHLTSPCMIMGMDWVGASLWPTPDMIWRCSPIPPHMELWSAVSKTN